MAGGTAQGVQLKGPTAQRWGHSALQWTLASTAPRQPQARSVEGPPLGLQRRNLSLEV